MIRRTNLPKPSLAWALAACGLCLLASCRTTPPPYPSFGSPEETWHTYKQAWARGDLAVIQALYGGVQAVELRHLIEARGVEEASAWFSRDFDLLRFEDEEFYHEGQNVAYLSVLLSKRGMDQQRVRFSFVRFGRTWKIVALLVQDPLGP